MRGPDSESGIAIADRPEPFFNHFLWITGGARRATWAGMSSVPRLVAAKAVEPSNLPSLPSHDTPWAAALDSPESLMGPTAFGNVWGDIIRGRLRPLREAPAGRSVCLLGQATGRPCALVPDDASLVVKVLCGEPRKALAAEMGIAVSTATGRFLRALDKLGLGGRNIPLPLVLAAQSWAGVDAIPTARTGWFDHEGARYMALSVPRPSTERLPALTRGQQEVALWLIEGLTRYEIANLRRTSVHTVARQFHSIYNTLRVTGRYELIRRVVELDCFSEPRGTNPP